MNFLILLLFNAIFGCEMEIALKIDKFKLIFDNEK